MHHWIHEAVFYHIYPLGLCGAPGENDFILAPQPRLLEICGWIGHMKSLGVNAVYLGPLFESTSHGYDTADFFHVDRRLGDNGTLRSVIEELHGNGIRVVLDGVFNHVGRDFWAFRDVLQKKQSSRFINWFSGLNFEKRSPYDDPFSYDAWNGYFNLVRLNLRDAEVKGHIFGAVREWIEQFDIDGIRLDCADCLDFDFMRELSAFCKSQRENFWLMGEVIHGDYVRWVQPGLLDSVTNYECYKGLYSSHNDKNYFEIAYSLNRQFGEHGIYRDLMLYSFADNHDVARVASSLKKESHLYPLYALLFTMPGIPSVYYGSEWGTTGEKRRDTDQVLRPRLDLGAMLQNPEKQALRRAIGKFAEIRKNSKALKYGSYGQVLLKHEQFAFLRRFEDECIIVAVNASDTKTLMELEVPVQGSKLVDLANPGESFRLEKGKCRNLPLYPNWVRILKVEG